MCSRARAIAIRSGVSCPSLGLTLLLLVGCGDSSNEDADAPKSTATASSATTSGSSAGGSSAGGSSATANGMGAEATNGTGGSASTGGGSGGSGGSGGTAGAGGAPDTTGTSDTGGTGAGGTGGTGADGVACVPDGAFCRVAPAACPEMQVRAVDGSCWGECVPIGDCVCSGPEDCPDEGQYTCHNFSGRCGPYL